MMGDRYHPNTVMIHPAAAILQEFAMEVFQKVGVRRGWISKVLGLLGSTKLNWRTIQRNSCQIKNHR
jgi:hypothetical protein